MKEATLDQGFDWLKRLKDAGLSREQIQVIFDSGILTVVFDAVKADKTIDTEEVRKVMGLEPLLLVYKIVVDYGISLAEMIKTGKYDWVNDDIVAKNFPIQIQAQGNEKQELEITLFHFNRYIGSDDAIKEIDKAGYRPVSLAELLALGTSQPELQRQFPIIALGSVWQYRNGYRYVPYLWYGGSNRRLSLGLFEGGWDPYCRFAVARK